MREAAVVGLTRVMEEILVRGDSEVFLQGEDGALLIQTFLKNKKCAIVIALLKDEKLVCQQFGVLQSVSFLQMANCFSLCEY